MDKELRVTGIILKDGDLGDFDRRISLLTLERGRISAFLKGAKRSGRSTLSSLTPFCFGDFFLFEGKSSYTVLRTNIKNRFDSLKGDLSGVAYGSYFLEVCEYYSRENGDETERLKLLYQSLRALESDAFENEFVRLIFELKNIAVNGEYPNVFECASCKSKEELIFFSLEKRSIFCEDCKDKVAQALRLSPGVLKALMFIFITPPEKLYTFKLSAQAAEELREFTDLYLNRYFPHKFKSLEYLHVLTS